MKDNEIIKALECCAVHGLLKCEKCPKKNEGVTCMYALSKDALDLINRQKAEIERLRESIKFERERVDAIPNLIKQTIKEFAERLKENAIPTFTPKGIVTVEGINKIVAELMEQKG